MPKSINIDQLKVSPFGRYSGNPPCLRADTVQTRHVQAGHYNIAGIIFNVFFISFFLEKDRSPFSRPDTDSIDRYAFLYGLFQSLLCLFIMVLTVGKNNQQFFFLRLTAETS